jgi:hypothetical protein
MARHIFLLVIAITTVSDAQTWIPVVDRSRGEATGDWRESQYRYTEGAALSTTEDGAALSLSFQGGSVALRFGQQDIPVYNIATFGYVDVEVDGKKVDRLDPLIDALEVVVARDLVKGDHKLRLVHHREDGRAGCLIDQIGIFDTDVGEISFSVAGEAQAYLVDCRVTVERQGVTVRRALSRNWRSGQCRLAGLSPGDGYRVRVQALGWETWVSDEVMVRAGEETDLGSVVLRRAPDAETRGVLFPALGRPAIREPSASFRIRFAGYASTIDSVRIHRQVGPATVTRTLAFEEDRDRAFYYDQELVATLPEDTPPGVYDLLVSIHSEDRAGVRHSPRSVYVPRRRLGDDPVFMTWGHYDTWGQYQAEYLSRVADTANLLGADMVLISNAVNPAYLTGALAGLDLPYMVTFGNHKYHGHEKWYGHPVHRVDYGDVSILNFGLPWHEDIALADKLLGETEATIRVINGFEANAPIDFLDRHKVSFIHDAHGPGTKVMQFGKTPTQRAGKLSSMSFRLVRFAAGRVVSCTYAGDDQAPIPFPREGSLPIRVEWETANDGSRDTVKARVVNELDEAFPGCRLTFILPKGTYRAEGGRVAFAWDSDDTLFTVAEVLFDLPATSTAHVGVLPASP